ncbi:MULTISPECIES: xanthine dehydrogenase family protein subunit M [unclassified Bradyrhizobium]|uniref:FAD binding domain-containing protein n=1 Tax=unclassified Bradyrhizobium TaxID=2631580 RepID=UPI002479E78A|nr:MULTISPECIES: xanthine dehydrogenase family protein subunit M [unclassified Bradyrhizobium]WGS17840.1 xanthine dehydrogenase family protein subunit M [Bradyrhizobium sp. ISRA463]WGS24640.1 xanthine dehydrogenase family protein subunit M [Bradyrhizobium sp. ISRA464]
MIPFTLEAATTPADAIRSALLGGRYIAGGTTLVDLMHEEVERPEHLIDINALALTGIRADGDDLVIGALARMSDVAAHPDVQRLQPMIAESLIEGASPQLRNMASMGGNLLQRCRCPYFRMLDAACNKRDPGAGCAAVDGLNAGHAILGISDSCAATHPSDVAVAFIALDAMMTVLGPDGERSFAVEDLFLLPGTTPHLEHALRPGELITEIRVPGGPHARAARYLKVRDRQSYEFALVSAAAALHVESGVIRDVRIACGGVGTKPWRMRSCEAALIGIPPQREAFAAAAALSTEGARPLAHNAYKVALLPRTITRALEMAGELA